jgi:hypothetical protein
MFSLTPKIGSKRSHSHVVDFKKTAAAALLRAPSLVPSWLPDGRLVGSEWMARNPNRADLKIGSFSINLRTGAWADFAVGDARGGDLISLRAYLDGTSQFDAARAVAEEVGA